MTTETNEIANNPVEEKEEMAEEQDVEDWDDVQPPPDDAVPEPPATEEEKQSEEIADPPAIEEEKQSEEKADIVELDTGDADVEAGQEPSSQDITPDFSKYKTNVAERLWRAKKAAEKLEVTSSPDLIKRTSDYQEWRKKMGFLNKYIEEYATAMQVVSEKRNQLFKQYALLSEDTPLWDHVGKPLAEDQTYEIPYNGNLTSIEGIEERTKYINEVAAENGAGSLMSHQELAMMQEELNIIDYKSHNVNHIDEWEKVVTSQLDDDVKAVRELSKTRDHYIEKVDNLRTQVNKIEHRGKGIAPKKLSDQLIRNEKKLGEADALYQEKSHEVSVVLHEATARGWVDFYPVIKNVMKFEINRLGRESSCYGAYHSTLTALKADYKNATKNTADAPTTESAL